MARPRKGSNDDVKKMCLKCSKMKHSINDFYMSYSSMHSDGRVPYCKSCLSEVVGDGEDMSSVKDALRAIDRPFIESVWERSIEGEGHSFGLYMKNIAMPQFRDRTWMDSSDNEEDFKKGGKKKGNKKDVVSIDMSEFDFVVTPDLIIKWGSGYTQEDYINLEEFYHNMKKSYEIETASHYDYLKKICKVSLKMDKALDDDDVDSYKKLSDVYDKLMHSAKFTAVQRSASDRTGGLNTFSEFFEYIEKEGFIPNFHISEPQDIVDETLDNLKKFTRQLVLGDSNLAQLIEESIKKMAHEEEETFEDDDDINDNKYEESYLDLEDGDE